MATLSPLMVSSPLESGRGILLLLGGLFLFSVQDLILKSLSGNYPLYEAMILRGLTAMPIIAAMAWVEGGLRSLWTPGTLRMIGRGLTMFVAYTAYYIALPALPLATTVALYFSAPLFITVLSVLILKEHVGPRRWAAVTAGFTGVIIMVRPGAELFEWAALLPILSGLGYALAMIQARSLGRTESAAAMAFWGNAVFLALALAMAAVFGGGAFDGASHPSLAFLTRGWVSPSWTDAGLMAACGVIAAAGLVLLTQAYRIAESNVIAPFEYSAMIWGVLWGWLFFANWPDAQGWTGIFIIVGAGLYVAWRERVRKG
ncbi:DMT family transporter [Aliigemmobacter aestuarii]|uniref:DMT family transporter n=1 Tax=Aliigemmobacter aestuarii TaxID=1445661 RepID=A0A4S3MPL5_9RHOB|nr:DMT family transporter [Gemmobacter aestuarii]THD84378.1 DMT family transporter [Gemmobacter aestuarii]